MMRLRILAVAALAATTLAACGSSGGGLAVANNKPAGANSQAGNGKSPAGGATPNASAVLGGGGGGDYCNTLKAQATQLATLENHQNGALGDFLKDGQTVVTALKKVEAAAPADIKQAWATLTAGFQSFLDALSKAGITPAQYADPSKLTPAQLQAMAQAGQAMGSGSFASAATQITNDVKTRCGIDLGGDSTDTGGSSGSAPTPAPNST